MTRFTESHDVRSGDRCSQLFRKQRTSTAWVTGASINMDSYNLNSKDHRARSGAPMHALSTDEATVNYVGIRPDLQEQVPWTLRPVDVNVTTRRPSAKKPKVAKPSSRDTEGGATFGEETQAKAEVGFFWHLPLHLPPAKYLREGAGGRESPCCGLYRLCVIRVDRRG